MFLIDSLYLLLIGLIRTVKWVELQLLKPFSFRIIAKSIETCGELGIICHFTDDSYQNWGPKDEKSALAMCQKYDGLLHLRVHDKSVFLEIINTGTWGIGEGYVSEKWTFCKDESDLVKVIDRLLENGLFDLHHNWWNRIWSYLEFDLFNLQTRSKSFEVIKKHYDLGNDLYEATLCPNMLYTCGYWANADNLTDAQLNKMELIAQKLKLKPGMRVLDIGCGWGSLCKYLAERHGVQMVGVTISKEGVDYGRKLCKGLPVEIRLQDYRDLNESFDRVVVVGMIEHVGFKNYDEFFKIVQRNLKDDGIFLLHTIGVNHKNVPRSERWLCTRIFPNGCLPKLGDLTKATEGRFMVEDLHNIGFDYTFTLAGWRENFLKNWPALKDTYGEEFYRIWIYYLAVCEGMMGSRKLQLWQIVYSKDGVRGGYRAFR